MIGDDGIEVERREQVITRERDYAPVRGYASARDYDLERDYAPIRRRRRSRIWRRERALDRVSDRDGVELERETFALAGFGMGGGGASLVMIGIVLMAIAYFGLGVDGFGGYPAADYGGGGGFSPEAGPYASSFGGYGGSDLLSQRPMMFMGGGFVFLAGWILVVAGRLRTFLSSDL